MLDQKIFQYFKDCDEVWHAGDIGDIGLIKQIQDFKITRAVFGNIDGKELRAILNPELIFELEGLRIWITHIAGYPPRYTPAVKSRIKNIKPNLLICGHSHILRIMSDKNLENFIYMNPGAAGWQGFHKVRTLVRFSIAEKLIKDVQVIELGNRG
jgi:hypothetical protein